MGYYEYIIFSKVKKTYIKEFYTNDSVCWARLHNEVHIIIILYSCLKVAMSHIDITIIS